jgi:hypothetical protein
VVDGGGAGLGLGEDDGVLVAHDAVLDVGGEVAGAEDADGGGVAIGGVAEDEDGGPDADLVAGVESCALADAGAVDPGAVLALEVADPPEAVVGGEFGVASADGVVGDGECFAGAADELGLVAGEFVLAACVGALFDRVEVIREKDTGGAGGGRRVLCAGVVMGMWDLLLYAEVAEGAEGAEGGGGLRVSGRARCRGRARGRGLGTYALAEGQADDEGQIRCGRGQGPAGGGG